MDDMNAFERQVAGEFVRRAGPVRQVDAAAIFTAITATPPTTPYHRCAQLSTFRHICLTALSPGPPFSCSFWLFCSFYWLFLQGFWLLLRQ